MLVSEARGKGSIPLRPDFHLANSLIPIISKEFTQMIQTILPDSSEQEAYFASFQSPLKKSISINRHRDADFEDNNSEFQLSQTVFWNSLKDTYYVDRTDTSLALGKTRQHLTWEFYIQEVAASLPSNILKQYLLQDLQQQDWSTRVPMRYLDIAAAPGGKTAQLASFMLAHDIPWVVRGNDIENKRLKSWSNNIQRCGLYNTVLTKLDGTKFGNLYPEFFDAILVDAPCSGEGTGFKSGDAFLWWKQESINQIVWLQGQILDSAFKSCKVGWLVIYSTCTLNVFENEGQIESLKKRYGDALEILPIEFNNISRWLSTDAPSIIWEEKKMLRAWPHIHHTGGFFVCVIRKTKSIASHTASSKSPSSSQQLPFEYSKSLEQQLYKNIKQVYGIDLDLDTYALIKTKHYIYLADASVKDLLSQWVWLQECGVPILKASGRSRSLEHNFWLVLWDQATTHTVELTTKQLQDYVLGEHIMLEKDQSKWEDDKNFELFNNFSLLTHRGHGVWVGKINKGEIKNKFLKW